MARTAQRASKPAAKTRSLSFPLDVEDGWPPVAVECLPFEVVRGGLRLLVPPLFVKKLSVGDVIEVKERQGQIESWKAKRPSKQSTIWLLRLRGDQRAIKKALEALRDLGCLTTTFEQVGAHSIGVPAEASIERVDGVLATLDRKKVAVAYPSFRHPEP